ncbi:alpha/beta-hydrolase [Sesbania bispinosa]|nr:alpha/beta-hydrolase [Sesbania bispinosa]
MKLKALVCKEEALYLGSEEGERESTVQDFTMKIEEICGGARWWHGKGLMGRDMLVNGDQCHRAERGLRVRKRMVTELWVREWVMVHDGCGLIASGCGSKG